MSTRVLRAVMILAGWTVLAPGPTRSAVVPPRAVETASAAIAADRLLAHIRVLASDEFEGRGLATPGETKTVDYLTNQFRALGLQPGNPDGSWVQNVPLVGATAEDVAIACRANGRTLPLAFPRECVVWSKRSVPDVRVANSEVVFVGYGVAAPEYGWDDFKDVDVRGKTILMLINDPPVPDPSDTTRLDPAMFKGRAMTYYGRWTYKFEQAAAKGAAAAIIVHETGPAGYPWAVVEDSNAGENFDLERVDANRGRAAIEGWMTLEKARELFRLGGQDFDALKQRAVGRGFRPVSLPVQISVSLRNRLRAVQSRNVVARLEGSDPRLKQEYVLFTAHWDHLGRNLRMPGSPIYHGALDNASGVATLLELARAFRALPAPPRRTLLFLSVTAEEKGLLGAAYYVEHPLHPLASTVADLNMDGVNAWGRTRDLEIVGYGNSTLEDLARDVAAAQRRVVTADSEPEKGRYFRSDHFEFAKLGVPALYLKPGIDFLDKPGDFGRQKMADYTARDYHKPTDVIKPDWDLSGAVEDARLLFEVGWLAAQAEDRPRWKPGSEFNGRSKAE